MAAPNMRKCPIDGINISKALCQTCAFGDEKGSCHHVNAED